MADIDYKAKYEALVTVVDRAVKDLRETSGAMDEDSDCTCGADDGNGGQSGCFLHDVLGITGNLSRGLNPIEGPPKA